MTTTEAALELTDIFARDQLGRLAALQSVASFSKGMFGTTNPGTLIELAEYVVGEPDVPFDPVALAHEARADLAAEQDDGYSNFGPVGYINPRDWGQALRYDNDEPEPGLRGGVGEQGPELVPASFVETAMKYVRDTRGPAENPIEGDITVSNSAGFLTDWERMCRRYEEPVVGDITVSDLAGFLTLPETAILEDDEGDIWYHDDDGWFFGTSSTRYSAERIFATWPDAYSFIVTNPEVLS